MTEWHDETQAASTVKEVEPVTVHVESAPTPEALAWSLDNATDDFTAPTGHSWRRSIRDRCPGDRARSDREARRVAGPRLPRWYE